MLYLSKPNQFTMKKQLRFKAFIFLCFILGNYSYAQVLDPVRLKTSGVSTLGTTTTFLKHNPNFDHAHDGDFCFASHISNDWVNEAGISEKYKEEEEYQNNLVSHLAGGDRSSYTIPVIFHVIYNTPLENVSETAINDLLDAVNEDFSATNSDIIDARTALGFDPANADITFCLARQDPFGVPLAEHGIHRVPTVETWFDPDSEVNKMKGSTGGDTGTEGWDRDRYLNVWICDITNGAGFGVAGYAYKPTIGSLPPADIDGIVIDYNLGMVPSNRVLTHEIGHFLGLDHPWGGGSGSCGTDDGLTDTPNTAGPSFDFSGSCSGTQQTCPGVNTQYENYMDYSNCTVMYTDDQVTLMHLILENSRLELTDSDVCSSPFPEPPVADFVADITAVIAGGSINFSDLSTNSPTSWSWTVSPMAGVSYIGGTSASSQNPVIQFDITGLYSITLTATNAEGSDSEVKTSYIEVIAGGDGSSACDTLRNYTDEEFENVSRYSIVDEAGYYPSQLTLDGGGSVVQAYAESFNAGAPTFVKRIILPIYQADDIGGSSNVVFNVWDDLGGLPGTVIGSEVVAIDDLNEGFFNIIDFSSPVAVSGDYWVGIEYDYSSGFDTVSLGTTSFADRPAGPSTTSMFITGGFGWLMSSDVFGGEPNSSLIIDVLTSNGASPVPNVSFPISETCEGMEVTMNGFGSLNTTDYFWDITDGSDFYGFDEANLTTAFDEGTWTIQLIVDGACESVSSPEYTLFVNPALDVVVNTLPENCSEADGEINFTVSGGDAGPYDYSINGGVTFAPLSAFDGLSSGSYNYLIKDDNHCEAIGVAVVENDISFSPSISPDVLIAPGTSTELTVSGGVNWSWYDGADFLGSSASITVAPLETTTYVCNVEDAEGCEAVLEVTVIIDDGSGIAQLSLEHAIKLYPNPASELINLAFELNEERNVSISLYNILGETVFELSEVALKKQVFNVNVSDFSKGVYFVRIQSENESVTKKITIE